MSVAGAIVWGLFVVVVGANVWLALDKRAKERSEDKARDQRETFRSKSAYWSRLRR